MDQQDRQAIDGLFNRLGSTERQAGPQDAEAEALIRNRVGAQPNAPYYMAQTIVMQDYALRQAEARIAELEDAASRPSSGGGILSGFFGGGRNESPRRPGMVPNTGRAAADVEPTYRQPPFPQQQQAARGGGFLAGAAQTAMGVAGGVLLGNAIGSIFSGGGEAKAAEPTPAEQPEPEAAETGDSGGGFFDSFFGGGDDEF